MAAEYSGSRSSNTQLLAELEALSQTLYQKPNVIAAANRRTTSLALPRSSVPSVFSGEDVTADDRSVSRPRSRRLSLSPWRSKSTLKEDEEEEKGQKITKLHLNHNKSSKRSEEPSSSAVTEEKRGIWNWKPIRGLYRIGMQKLSCLFSVEVEAAQSLPASMNGLRLGVCVRKKETKDGAVQTMPARVSQGSADFEETLFVRCHVYYSTAKGKNPAMFEPRPFYIYLFAVDAKELDFGRQLVDLSELIQESIEKMNYEGARVRQWDLRCDLSGKAKGGELVLKFGFQVMEKDGGAGIYSKQGDFGINSSNKQRNFSVSFGRKQSKTSFSVPSPKMNSRIQTWTPAGDAELASDFQGIEHLNLDEPEEKPGQKTNEQEQKQEDDLPEFDVVDKGVEFDDHQDKKLGEQSDENFEEKSASSEMKEMTNDPGHIMRLTELDSIAKQIKALESMMKDDGNHSSRADGEENETESQRLDEEEETVTREFLQLLEDEETEKLEFYQHKMEISEFKAGKFTDSESENYVPDLGKGIGCVIQTRDGGYLVAMNPFDTVVSRKDSPKLAMQISKPMVILLREDESPTGFELFHRMSALGKEELVSRLTALMPMDELMGKTGEQVAFEGIASAIIHGRKKERANASAARTIAAVKTMGTSMSSGRKERILTGIWNVDENHLTAEEVLAVSLQKMEEMVIEGLKIQAGMADGDPPFKVSATNNRGKPHEINPLASVISLDEWLKNRPSETQTLAVIATIQLRDPLRRYEAVGGPVVAVIQAAKAPDGAVGSEEEKVFKMASLHVGGVKVAVGGGGGRKDAAERRRLTAAQWLVAYGMGIKGNNKQQIVRKDDHHNEEELMWSLSSRVMADMWLKSIRNPDVRFHS